MSTDSGGAEGDGDALAPSVSADGTLVVFESFATNHVPGDTNGFRDVFLRDRAAGTTARVSLTASSGQANGESYDAHVSDDGSVVAFVSRADNLVTGDTNFFQDVFVRDMQAGTTTLVSRSITDGFGDFASYECALSGDGRIVAFTSVARNLVPNDTNVVADIFVRDLATGTTERVSVSSSGAEADQQSGRPALSADGRFVAFRSLASNLVPNDTAGHWDVFVHDRVSGLTVCASLGPTGDFGSQDSFEPDLSANGLTVAFWSRASNLVSGDTNNRSDVFVRNLVLGATQRVSVAPDGSQLTGDSDNPALSADARFVAFDSAAKTVIPNDTNGAVFDVFVRDLALGVTRVASVDSSGIQGDQNSRMPALAADGRTVAFESDATDLVPGDTNGKNDVFAHDLPPVAPVLDLKVNGADGSVTLAAGTPLAIAVSIPDTGDFAGQASEWWIQAATPFGDFWMVDLFTFVPSPSPVRLLSFPVFSLQPTTILANTVLPVGTYTFTFWIDPGVDGVLDGVWSDAVQVILQ